MSDIRIYTAAQAGGLTPLTGDIILCSEAFNGAPANSVHLALAGGATPTWKSFANDAEAEAEIFINQNSLSFNGSSSQYLGFADTLGIPSSTSVSLSCWINCSNTTASQQLFGTNNKVFSVELWGPTNVFYVEMGQSKFATLSNMRNYITQGSWHHIAVVYDGSGSTNADKIKLYIDGQLMTLSFTGTIDSAMPSFSHFYFGKGFYNVYYRGLLDECALWNSTALTSGQIASLIDSSGANPVPADLSSFINNGLSAWWRMGDDSSDTFVDGGSVASITDSSGNGNTATQATASRQPTFSTDVPA